MGKVGWVHAWQEALYGAQGFYRAQVPARQFGTATHPPLGAVLAEAIWHYADLLELSGVVDIGAGRGELIGALHSHRPDRPLLGVDVIERPDELPAGVRWLRGPGGAPLPDELADLDDVLVVAHEWLDVVPCVIGQLDGSGVVREVLVDPATGDEALGDPLDDADLAWHHQFWPLAHEGDRVEIGRARDLAWADLLTRVCRGAAIAIDAGHVVATRPRHGSLAAYRGEEVVRPVPDGSCDLSAQVAVDSLRHDEIHTQTTAFESFGVWAPMPDPALARCDEAAYRRRLRRATSAAQLTDPAGHGAFRWVVVRQAGAITSRS